MDKAVLRSLERLLPGQVITQPVELLTYDADGGNERGLPQGVAFPRTTDDVVRLVEWAARNGVPLIARGAGTGLSGGAVAERGGVLLGFSRMNRVTEFDEAGRSAVAQPGVVTLALDELVKSRGLYFPPDPASARASTLGGNLAENAGGPHCFKYGVTTNYVTGLTVVLADGRAIQLGGRALDYPEYDLTGLLVGSEGTLGLITEASVRLTRNPLAIKTMLAAFDSVQAAGQAVSAIIAQGLVPATLELMDQKIMRIIEEFAQAGLPVEAGAALIIETDGYPASVSPQMDEIVATLRACGVREMRVAQTAAERDQIWYGRKSTGGAITRLAPAYYPADSSVPRSRLAQALADITQVCDELGLRVGYLAHAGDGNLHPHILMDDPDDPALLERVHTAARRVMEVAVAHGGTITGEHGVGIEKRAFMPLMFNAVELDAMQEVKELFDPRHLLNPGKIFPAGREDGGQRSEDGGRRSEVGSRRAETGGSPAAQRIGAALRDWAAAGQSVRIRGNGTKSSHLAQTDVLVSTLDLQDIHRYAPDDLYITVGAGMELAQLQAHLRRDHLWAPLASPLPRATLGGLAATNWNAPMRMRYGYGSLRDQVLAATVVLPDGRVIRTGRPVVKNVAGYDMTKLFVGSHGTLGVIADLTLKLSPLPRASRTLLVPVDDLENGLAWGARLLQVCLVASALLICRGCDAPDISAPYALIFTAEGVREDVETELAEALGVLKSQNAPAARLLDAPSGSEMWAAWLGQALASGATARVGVAPKALPDLIRKSDMSGPLPFMADLASGLLYLGGAGVQALEPVRQSARQAGGYAVVLNPASGAADVWGYAPDSLDLMRALKARWDPRGLLNPGAFIV